MRMARLSWVKQEGRDFANGASELRNVYYLLTFLVPSVYNNTLYANAMTKRVVIFGKLQRADDGARSVPVRRL